MLRDDGAVPIRWEELRQEQDSPGGQLRVLSKVLKGLALCWSRSRRTWLNLDDASDV